MLNIVLVGGPSVDQMEKTFSNDSYKLSGKFKFVSEMVESLSINYGEYLDVNTFIVLQYGINTEELVEQIQEVQEVVSVLSNAAKIYFVIKDTDKYDICAKAEDIIIYDETHIIPVSTITAAEFDKIITGAKDKVGIYKVKEEKQEIYEEPEQPKVEDIFKSNDEDEEEEDEEEKEEIPKLPIKKKEKKEKKEKKVAKKIEKEYVENNLDVKFKGIVAVTGTGGCGKTTVAANLAELFAYKSNATLLIDFDYKQRNMALLYPDFAEGRKFKTATQMGIMAGLNNSDNLEDLAVVVKDNLALLASGLDDDCFPKKFADIKEHELFTLDRIYSLLGNAKADYEVVVVDMPFEYLIKYPALIMLVDKFVFPVDNNVVAMYNTFEVLLKEVKDTNISNHKNIINKLNVVVNRYNEESRIGNKKVTPEYVANVVFDLGKSTKLVGTLNYDEIYAKQYSSNKRAVDLSDEIYREFDYILNNLLSV